MVVSNTTPLSNLLHLEQTQILPELFGSILVPVAVRDELEAYFDESSSWRQCVSAGWVVVEPVEDRRLVRQFMTFLHAGEAEALVLALEKRASLRHDGNINQGKGSRPDLECFLGPRPASPETRLLAVRCDVPRGAPPGGRIAPRKTSNFTGAGTALTSPLWHGLLSVAP